MRAMLTAVDPLNLFNPGKVSDCPVRGVFRVFLKGRASPIWSARCPAVKRGLEVERTSLMLFADLPTYQAGLACWCRGVAGVVYIGCEGCMHVYLQETIDA